MMISIEMYMTDNEPSVPENLQGRMGPTDETTGVTDAGMDGLLPVGQLEGNRIIQISSASNCRFLGRNSR
jgi:hypothetical protein